jgi:hypothetical protein
MRPISLPSWASTTSPVPPSSSVSLPSLRCNGLSSIIIRNRLPVSGDASSGGPGWHPFRQLVVFLLVVVFFVPFFLLSRLCRLLSQKAILTARSFRDRRYKNYELVIASCPSRDVAPPRRCALHEQPPGSRSPPRNGDEHDHLQCRMIKLFVQHNLCNAAHPGRACSSRAMAK